MKPYYDRGGITIFHGDCREILGRLEPETFDLVCADPPYGDTELDWDSRDLSWLRLSDRLLKRSGTVWCFGSMRMFLAQAAEVGIWWRIAQDLVWEKHNGSSFHADRFRRVHEHIVQWYRHTTRWNDVYKNPVMEMGATARRVHRKRRPRHLGDIGAGHFAAVEGGPKMMRSVIYARSCHGHAVHPTQKPREVVRPLLTYSCPPGGIVLDPTMGSGTALVVAQELGLRAVGIEIDEAMCRQAVDRLSQVSLLAGAR